METILTKEPQVVVVDIGERQMPDEVQRLRNGQGKLLDHVERIIADLVAAGAVELTAQPVVFVVREHSSRDDEDDEDDEDNN